MVNLKEKMNIIKMGKDIPFYNNIPKLSKWDWTILTGSVLLLIGFLTIIPLPSEYLSISFFLLGLLPALYICKGKYNIFFKKISLKDIKLIILLLIGMYIYNIVMGAILVRLTGSIAGHSEMNTVPILIFVISMIIQIFGEEFFKIFLLLILMYLVYRFTNNYKSSIIIGLIGSMIIFGLCHYMAYNGRILQILLLQGFGSIFEYFAYIKTKNIWVSYLLHLLRDILPVFLIYLTHI